MAYVSGGQGQSLTGQATAQDIASIDPNIVNAVQSGNASWTFDDAGQGYLYDKSTGLALPGATVRDLGNGQIAIQMGSGNNIIQAQATTKEDGSINPVSASDVYTAKFTPYAKDAFADLGSNLIKVGLAYALPILGEAIAAELAVSAATGTALAAVGTGVAQGKSLEEAIKSAAPALIAGNVISASGLSDLTGRIASSPDMQNVINNVATSTVKTAISGGSVNDILNSAIASGGGTLIGQSLTNSGLSASTSQAVGQGLATGAITGNALSGVTAAAGSLGGSQAKDNAADRAVQQSVIDAFDKASTSTTSGGTQVALLPALAANLVTRFGPAILENPALLNALQNIGAAGVGILGAAGLSDLGVVQNIIDMVSQQVPGTTNSVVAPPSLSGPDTGLGGGRGITLPPPITTPGTGQVTGVAPTTTTPGSLVGGPSTTTTPGTVLGANDPTGTPGDLLSGESVTFFTPPAGVPGVTSPATSSADAEKKRAPYLVSYGNGGGSTSGGSSGTGANDGSAGPIVAGPRVSTTDTGTTATATGSQLPGGGPVVPPPVPVTADVQNVATQLGISTDDAQRLKNTNPTLFDNVSGKTQTDSTQKDADVMRLVDTIGGGAPTSGGGGQDFNVIIQGKQTGSLTSNAGSSATPADPQVAAIQKWLASNPTATDADVVAAMQQYNIPVAQIAAATGLPVSAVQNRYDAVIQATQSVTQPVNVTQPVTQNVTNPTQVSQDVTQEVTQPTEITQQVTQNITNPTQVTQQITDLTQNVTFPTSLTQVTSQTQPTVLPTQATQVTEQVTQKPTFPPTFPPTLPTFPPTFPPTQPTFPPTYPPTNPTFPPTKPTFPPTYPTYPTEPTFPPPPPPTYPTDKTYPTYPTFPTLPTRPTIKPTEPTKPPTYPTYPTDPTKPPTYPTYPTYPTDPTKVTEPTTKPTEPTIVVTARPTRKPGVVLPTIVGQFQSPLTQALTAYRPAGDIESTETGKEKQPVWNTESLRNALGI